MKIQHKATGGDPPSAVVSDEYEAEVQRSTQRNERLYIQAQKRLEQAEARLAKARSATKSKNRKKQIADLEALVELRRNELEEYRRMMVAVAASAEHRGTRSFRPVSYGGEL